MTGRARLSRIMTSSLVTILGSAIRVHNDRGPWLSIVCNPGLRVGWDRKGRLEEKGGQTGPHEDFHFITLEEVKKGKTMIISK